MKTHTGTIRTATALAALAVGLLTVPPAGAGTWIAGRPLIAGRMLATATLLSDGRVLVAGGDGGANRAELYDPATGSWTATGSMATARRAHTATLLPNGKVLVVGGDAVDTAELYDPATGTWTAAGVLTTTRGYHTATLLPNGKVLIAGGYAGYYPGGDFLSSTELYDPATGTWSASGSLNLGRFQHAAALLANGKVLITGGLYFGGYTGDGYLIVEYSRSAELYDPATGTWSATGSMSVARGGPGATLLPNGKVLITGGYHYYNGLVYLASAELYDSATGTWTSAGAMATGRAGHMSTLLPNGRVLVTCGYTGASGTGNLVSGAELYDPAAGTWTAAGAVAQGREFHTATLLANGRVLVAGGYGTNYTYLSSTELYDSASGTWTSTGALGAGRYFFTATLLPNGKVLAAGGNSTAGLAAGTELYDSLTGNWAPGAIMVAARECHTATLLPSGKVLVVAGFNGQDGILSSAELYDPVTRVWAETGAMAVARYCHTATVLRDGKVLVAGGLGPDGYPASSELYDPAAGTWRTTGPMVAAHYQHTATLLTDGRVLVAGGYNDTDYYLASAELYDPATETWTATGPMSTRRCLHTATLLQSGKVLIAGGYNGTTPSIVELYDPGTGTWTAAGQLASGRYGHTATFLSDGKVQVAGGYYIPMVGNSSALTSTELYDPVTGSWTTGPALAAARYLHQAILLPNAKVLLAGGSPSGGFTFVRGTELYDAGLGFSAGWQPQITSATSPLDAGGNLSLAGSRFRGSSEGSTGSVQNSPGDHPVVQLRSVESGQTLFLSATNWSATSFVSAPVNNFPRGCVLATVFVNGIPGASRMLAYGKTLIANNAVYTRAPGLSLRIPIADLLTNVTSAPADGATFTLVGVGPGSQGATIMTNSACILYAPANDNGDSFTYTAGDSAGASATGAITINVVKTAGPSLSTNSISLSGQTATIRAFGVPGCAYVLQTATNIVGPWWPVGTNTAGSDGFLLFIDPNATNLQRYYRTAQP